jgi:hypothetical protein
MFRFAQHDIAVVLFLEVGDLFGIWVLELGASPLREPFFIGIDELE